MSEEIPEFDGEVEEFDETNSCDIGAAIRQEVPELLSRRLIAAGKKLTATQKNEHMRNALRGGNPEIIKVLMEYYLAVLKDKEAREAIEKVMLPPHSNSTVCLLYKLLGEYHQKLLRATTEDNEDSRHICQVIADLQAYFLKNAITNYREVLLASLLKERALTPLEKSEYSKLARSEGNLIMTQLLVPEDELYYLRDLTDFKLIEKAILTAYRKAPHSKLVDKFLENYLLNQRSISRENAADIIIKIAIRDRNKPLVDFVLKNSPLSPEKRTEYAQLARTAGDIAILQEFTQDHQFYFQNLTTLEQMGEAISCAYRYSDMEQVDDFLHNFLAAAAKEKFMPASDLMSLKTEIFKRRTNFLS